MKTNRTIMAITIAALLPACASTSKAPDAKTDPLFSAQQQIGTRESMASHAVYFVLTDRFVNGDPSNDQRGQGKPDPALFTFDRPTPLPADGSNKGKTDNIGYLGGDFRGILNNAKYIRDMGFGALWLTPIVDNPDQAFTGGEPVQWNAMFTDRGKTGYHGYWGVNFYKLDEHWPSAGLDFKALTQGLRDAGLLTVLDIVCNHGSPAFTMPKAQPGYGQIFDGSGKLVADHQNLEPEQLQPQSNPLHAFYHPKKDLVQLPNIDENNPAVLEYFVGAYDQWIQQGANAFRIDTIRHMPHSYWKAFSDRIRAKHPGFFMFGESFEFDANKIAQHTKPENGGITVLDFPMQKAMTEAFVNGKGYETLTSALHLDSGVYHNPYELMTFYDNHDMPRINATDSGFINANNWLFTARGIPVVYQGSEIGFERGTAEHGGNRNYFGQANIDSAPNHVIYQNLRTISNLRARTPALQRGVQINLRLEGEEAVFLRVLDAELNGALQKQAALVLLNKSSQPRKIGFSSDKVAGTWKDAMTGSEVKLSDTASLEVAANGVLVLLR